MADEAEQSEKTEDPSEKRLRDAREKGNVVKSQEVNSWFMLTAATLVVMIFSGGMAADLSHVLQGFLFNAHDLSLEGRGSLNILSEVLLAVLAAVSLPFLVFIVAALGGNLVQHGFLLQTETMTPKLSKISPLAGLKRLFSMTSLVNFTKSLAKLLVVTILIIVIMWPDRDGLEVMVSLDPAALLPLVKDYSVKILAAVAALYTVIAMVDYAYQRQQWWNKLKMTMQEVKDEYKQQEGDPMVKAKIRQIRMERGRKRMMQAVPEASVVITNPTHYAVALKYEAGMPAPICVAKGMDALALKIREIAKDNEIPLVENPPLARALHAGVEVDDEIPPEHYKAVAEVIGFIMRKDVRR
ncbi:MAG: flagellar biosynthesis protein FlhB [Rhodomicrobium sp.]|nr:MAG: flagellar biosynthesis protein FlhB [Rhodomicrobium sp.]